MSRADARTLASPAPLNVAQGALLQMIAAAAHHSELRGWSRPPAMSRFRLASGALERRLERGLLHPIDFLRTRMTRGLQVCAGNRPVRRGEHVDAHVTISRPRGVERVEAGLVCTAVYASAVSDGRGGRSRGTASATVHEAWLPVEGAPGVHSVRLTVPANAPFSYEGDLLCFRWEVIARGRRARRLDPQARHSVAVLP
jgi:hypothetical protein